MLVKTFKLKTPIGNVSVFMAHFMSYLMSFGNCGIYVEFLVLNHEMDSNGKNKCFVDVCKKTECN